ncbi:hypothetical protein AAFF_G00394570 [Aldrovandia affinis]|uniref:Uncharacterized protein n=1 Tax=Aldrovandia affinis TaxID=143900 RepID=A0AAD7SDV2_9TELE|nr:hypothetical protein AAFF_G00394570 [Aldrovandia affinis]
MEAFPSSVTSREIPLSYATTSRTPTIRPAPPPVIRTSEDTLPPSAANAQLPQPEITPYERGVQRTQGMCTEAGVVTSTTPRQRLDTSASTTPPIQRRQAAPRTNRAIGGGRFTPRLHIHKCESIAAAQTGRENYSGPPFTQKAPHQWTGA